MTTITNDALAKLQAAVAVETTPPPIMTVRDYLATEIPVPPRLVSPALLVRGGIHLLSGPPGKGKTTFMLNCIASWAAGRNRFPGLDVLRPEKPLKTLIIENEGAAGEFHHKMGVLLHKGPLTDDEREQAMENILVWGDGGYTGFKLDEAASLEQLRKGCEQYQPDIVFMEPLIGLWSGEENSATEMRKILDVMQAVAGEFSCSIAIIHHDRKSGAGEDGDIMHAARGSGALAGAVTSQAYLKMTKGGEQREWGVSKSRHEQMPSPIRLTFHAGSHWYDHIPEEKGVDEVMEYLTNLGGEAATIKEIAAELEEPEHRVRRIIQPLKKEGRIKQTNVRDGGVSSFGFRVPVDPDGQGTGGLAI